MPIFMGLQRVHNIAFQLFRARALLARRAKRAIADAVGAGVAQPKLQPATL